MTRSKCITHSTEKSGDVNGSKGFLRTRWTGIGLRFSEGVSFVLSNGEIGFTGSPIFATDGIAALKEVAVGSAEGSTGLKGDSDSKIPQKAIDAYDINPYKYGKSRGLERLVDTPDHYKTWYQIR